MNIKFLMVDLPLTKRSSPTFQVSLAQQLLSTNSDLFCCFDFSENDYTAFYNLFDQAGFDRFAAVDSGGYGLLVLARTQLLGQKIVEMHPPHPHLLHLRLDKLDLIFLKILALSQTKNKNLDFQNRRAQFGQALAYVDSLASEELVITGNFNHGVINRQYAGKPRQFYNYQIIENELKKRSILLAPLTGSSYSYSYRGCPLTLEHIGARNVTIQNPAYANMGIGKHSALIATVRK